ncbi:MAG TPA: hypothetical protein VFR85_19200 [Anaeromyxobacteraceae bacterium]|nr:hypothetical protein [Anaeromyxobacteraceae bacterium]
MRFTCPSCGARYGSDDEPASGRVYSIGCRCGRKLHVAGAPPAPGSAPGASYDAYAASHGLLLDEGHARSLASGRPVLEPATQAAAGDEVEVTVTFSTVLRPPRGEQGGGKAPEAAPEQSETGPPAAAAWVPPAWSAPAAALLAFVLAGGGTAWALLPQAGDSSPMALLARFSPASELAPATPEPSPARAEPESPFAQPEAAPPPFSRVSDPAPEPARAKAATAARGKAALARERRLARRSPADRR